VLWLQEIPRGGCCLCGQRGHTGLLNDCPEGLPPHLLAEDKAAEASARSAPLPARDGGWDGDRGPRRYDSGDGARRGYYAHDDRSGQRGAAWGSPGGGHRRDSALSGPPRYERGRSGERGSATGPDWERRGAARRAASAGPRYAAHGSAARGGGGGGGNGGQQGYGPQRYGYAPVVHQQSSGYGAPQGGYGGHQSGGYASSGQQRRYAELRDQYQHNGGRGGSRGASASPGGARWLTGQQPQHPHQRSPHRQAPQHRRW
jgi:hypothetical protein